MRIGEKMNQYETDYKRGYDACNGKWIDTLDKIKTEIEEQYGYCDICEYFEDYDYDENNISEYRYVASVEDILKYASKCLADEFKEEVFEQYGLNKEKRRKKREKEEKERHERAIQKEINSVLDRIRAEIQENINYNKKMNYQGIVAGLLVTLDIIDKYKDKGVEE